MRATPFAIALTSLLVACEPAPALTAPPLAPRAVADAPHTDDVGQPGPFGEPAVAGDIKVWAHRPEGAFSTELRVAERRPDGAWGPHRTLIGPVSNPDRPALSPDGRYVAFVWGITGLASIWLLPTDAQLPDDPKAPPIPERALQLTHQGLTSGQGRPDGFLPPPLPGTLRFDADHLRWQSDEGEHAVRWR